MTRVKICGVTCVEDALFAAEAGADALGFNFYPKSKRYVTPEAVRAIIDTLPPFVTTVGILVNETRDRIEQIVETSGIQILQLHGDETPNDCKGHTLPVIRALGVGDRFDIKEIEPYAKAGVESFLLDKAKDGFYGGTGETFDWALAVLAKSFGRVILAGGLTPDNVEEGVRAVAPYAVDTASGVESEPGKKDHRKIKAFIDNATRARMET